MPTALALVQAAGTRLPSAVVRRLVERARGNPLLLSELARAVRAGGDPDALPDRIDALMAARIHTLEPAQREAVRVASVLGARCRLEDVRDLLGTAPPAVPGVLEPRADGRGRVRPRAPARRGLREPRLPPPPRAARGCRARDRGTLGRGRGGQPVAALRDGARPCPDLALCPHSGRSRRSRRRAGGGDDPPRPGARGRTPHAHAGRTSCVRSPVRSATAPSSPDAIPTRPPATASRGGSRATGRSSSPSWSAARASCASAARATTRPCAGSPAGCAPSPPRRPATTPTSCAPSCSSAAAPRCCARGASGAPATVLAGAHDTLERSTDRAALANCLYLLAWALSDMARPTRPCCPGRWRSTRRSTIPPAQSSVLNNLGVDAYFAGNWTEALDYWERSRVQRDRTGDVV